MKLKIVYSLYMCLLFLITCSAKNVGGIYGNKKHPQNYFELKSDGSFL